MTATGSKTGESRVVWPELTLPEEEGALLKNHYDTASVILEYGSGGSTVYAAQKTNALCFSVESDRAWAWSLQRKLDKANPAHRTVLYPVNIGPVGAWGRPRDDTFWPLFHRYPLGIWKEDFFRHPDVVLIDGRFRPACLLTTCLLIERPITLLFDDYYTRPAYTQVEAIARPRRQAGRMAEFELTPVDCKPEALALLMELSTQATFPVPGIKRVSYDTDAQNRPLYYGGNPDIPARRP